MEICKREICTGCEACLNICPVKCIWMKLSTEGFAYPVIDESKCINCGKCRKTCPSINDVERNNKSRFFMGWHKSESVLRRSSSGGAFTAIADIVLDQGGIVIGAYYDSKDSTVTHIAIEGKEDLDKLRLSKYYQSSVASTYKFAKEKLKDRIVLFTGTACQIAGLYKFLGDNPNNLITVDVLCHGVASKKVIDSYISCKEKKYKKKISSIRFRLKPDDANWQGGGYYDET